MSVWKLPQGWYQCGSRIVGYLRSCRLWDVEAAKDSKVCIRGFFHVVLDGATGEPFVICELFGSSWETPRT